MTPFETGLTGPGVFFFFWMHFRLSHWMATHLCMCSATPSVYLDLEKGVSSKTKTVVVKATPLVILNKEELQPNYNYNVLTDKTGI